MPYGLARGWTSSVREYGEWRWFSHKDMSCWIFSPNTFKLMERTINSALNLDQAYSGMTGEKPPYKGGWCKIGWHQEGKDKPVFPKPQISSQVILILGPTTLNRIRPLLRMTTHWPRWYWTPGLATRKEWWWGEVAFSRWFLN